MIMKTNTSIKLFYNSSYIFLSQAFQAYNSTKQINVFGVDLQIEEAGDLLLNMTVKVLWLEVL